MKKTLQAALLIGLALFCAGCGKDSLTEGWLQQKLRMPVQMQQLRHSRVRPRRRLHRKLRLIQLLKQPHRKPL